MTITKKEEESTRKYDSKAGKYDENTNLARENKIFGSPSFVVDKEVFWGDDRMEDSIKWSNK